MLLSMLLSAYRSSRQVSASEDGRGFCIGDRVPTIRREPVIADASRAFGAPAPPEITDNGMVWVGYLSGFSFGHDAVTIEHRCGETWGIAYQYIGNVIEEVVLPHLRQGCQP